MNDRDAGWREGERGKEMREWGVGKREKSEEEGGKEE